MKPDFSFTPSDFSDTPPDLSFTMSEASDTELDLSFTPSEASNKLLDISNGPLDISTSYPRASRISSTSPSTHSRSSSGNPPGIGGSCPAAIWRRKATKSGNGAGSPSRCASASSSVGLKLPSPKPAWAQVSVRACRAALSIGGIGPQSTHGARFEPGAQHSIIAAWEIWCAWNAMTRLEEPVQGVWWLPGEHRRSRHGTLQQLPTGHFELTLQTAWPYDVMNTLNRAEHLSILGKDEAGRPIPS